MTTKSPLTRRAALTMMTGTALAAGSALCMPHVARAATGITVRDQGGCLRDVVHRADHSRR